MRQRTNAAETFTTSLLDSSDSQNAELVKERDGVRSGLGWNNRSWERRKKLEQAQQMQEQQERRLINEERRRMTPLGRMENSSLSVWNSIASPTFERVILNSYTSLLSFAEDSQLNSNLESMSYEQLLSGMLFPGEALQYIPPARIKTFRKVATGGKVLEEKSTLRAFFTDKRLFFIHTEFAQSPTVNYSSTKGSPLTRVKLKLSCDLKDSMFWTAVNLEKILAQTIDCEYKASTATTVIVSRPQWGLWTVVVGVIAGLAVAFMPQDNVQNLIGLSVLSLVLVVVGAWVLLTQRRYTTETSGTDSTRSRKILFGLDDPVFVDLVTLDCELEEDYALADAFEFIQGIRSVTRQLRGDVIADGDQLLNIDAITSQDGKQAADAGVEGVDEDSIKKLKEKGKTLRNKLDEAELKKRNPPKDRKRTVHLVEEDFGDDMDGVEDIKEKMKQILEKRQAEAQERAETGEALDDRLMNEEDFKAASASELGSGNATKAGKKSRLSRQKNAVQKMNSSWDDQSDDDADAFWKKGGSGDADEADSGESTGGGVMGRLGRRKEKKEASDD